MQDHVYAFNCTQVGDKGVGHLEQMIEDSRDVELSTLRRHIDLKEWEAEMGYGSWLRLKDDWCVSYSKSKIAGVPCYYITHSAIEHVWVPAERYDEVMEAMFR